MLDSVVPRILGWIPLSWRSAIIGRPDHPSRIATIAHRFLNRLAPDSSQLFACHGALEGWHMSIDWSRFRSFIYGTWEPEVVNAVTAAVKPGMCVVDVGAHIGYYTLLFAKYVGSAGCVISFEPLPANFALLQKNVHINNLLNVRLLNQAVFSQTQKITLNVPDEQPNPGNGSMYNLGTAKQCHVEAVSLDDFCGSSNLRPDVLKIDVEGAEYEVLIGAQRTISHCRPKLLIELHHFDGNPAAHPVPGLLASWGYEIRWVERWQLTSYIIATPAPLYCPVKDPQA